MAWEYEVLFDVEDMDRMTPIERAAMMDSGDRWKAEGSDLRKGRMGYRTKTIKAGPRLEAEIFPVFGKELQAEARKARAAVTTEKMQRYNDEKAKQHLIRLMDANFGRDDVHVTLTYGGQAPGWKRACADVRNFIERVKRRRARLGLPEMKYIYAMEDAEEGRDKKIHCHIVTQGDLGREELERIWGFGYCNCDQLQPGPEGLEALSRYIYQQRPGLPREKGKRKYSCSKNLKKPKSRISNTKVTPANVRRLSSVFAMDESEARRIMEKLYPGYEFVRGSARRSDVITVGVYIRVLMRRKEGGRL